jgi:type II secretion system protein J
VKRGGFTLLEVILASTLTAFVALVAVAGLRSVSSTRQTVDRAWAAADSLRYAADRIERDLASVVRGQGVIFEGQAADSAMELPMSLRMRVYQTDPARPQAVESDLYEVEYTLLQSAETTLFVRRICPLVGVEVDREETAGGMLTVLSESIVDFQVRYYDGTQWLEEWVTETELPRLVMITLAAAEETSENPTAAGGRSGPRLLTRTIWMHFPGEPTLDQAVETETQTGTTETEATTTNAQ